MCTGKERGEEILTGLYLRASRYDPNRAACALRKALATPLPVAVDCFFSLLFREDIWWKIWKENVEERERGRDGRWRAEIEVGRKVR